MKRQESLQVVKMFANRLFDALWSDAQSNVR